MIDLDVWPMPDLLDHAADGLIATPGVTRAIVVVETTDGRIHCHSRDVGGDDVVLVRGLLRLVAILLETNSGERPPRRPS
jgi:hypothetical protein